MACLKSDMLKYMQFQTCDCSHASICIKKTLKHPLPVQHDSNRLAWPNDWRFLSKGYISHFKTHGCAYLGNLTIMQKEVMEGKCVSCIA